MRRQRIHGERGERGERLGEAGAVALEYLLIVGMLLATTFVATLLIMKALGKMYMYMLTVVSSPLL